MGKFVLGVFASMPLTLLFNTIDSILFENIKLYVFLLFFAAISYGTLMGYYLNKASKS